MVSEEIWTPTAALHILEKYYLFVFISLYVNIVKLSLSKTQGTPYDAQGTGKIPQTLGNQQRETLCSEFKLPNHWASMWCERNALSLKRKRSEQILRDML